jgi:hypothetical protein
VGLDGGWQQLLFLAEGRCEGWISGRFRGANYPRRHGPEGPFRPDFRAVIEAEDGAVILVEWHGYGRAYPPGQAPPPARWLRCTADVSTTPTLWTLPLVVIGGTMLTDAV